MKLEKLPAKNASGYYEIRLESIGGLGANLCGKMLGELGVKYLGLNSTSFSSYGSEKTGTPVKGFVRYSEDDKEIRVHSPVTNPHLLCVFNQGLLSDTDIFEGCTTETRIIINTADKESIKEYFDRTFQVLPKYLFYVPAQKIAMETHSRINVVMLGAMAKVMGFITLEQANSICRDALGKKYPQALEMNLLGIKRGYEEVEKIQINNEQTGELVLKPEKTGNGEQTVWGYENAPIGGINTNYGNSVISDLSPSRQGYIPVFIKERCINCGLCDSTCPDMVFQFKKGEYKGRKMMVNCGLDYNHCKGCLRCVCVCPTQALVKGLESEYPDKKWSMPNKDLQRLPDYYEKTGADGYITSESFLTEKRIDGGEV